MSNIKVAVRVRPPIEREIQNGEKPIWKALGNTIYMESGKINTFHTFDHVFDSTSTNRDVYEKYCHPIVESVMQGFNGTIFAFGQTSSGKTHTMMGNSSQPGLIPLAINAIFDIIQNMPEREYLLRVSYLEIYNENILDLLDDSDGKHLQIRDNVDGQPVIVDLIEVPVGSKEEIKSAMNTGERRRHVASTEANQRSSRSHSIFRMVIESSRRDGADGAVAVGQLNLVDLAGSERTEQCGDSGERFRESTRINVSLTFLTQVISKLSRGERGHINFRDSKLTRILRNSLGGNAHTAIVCTVNPCCMEQTLRTLQFASSAKKIQNTPQMNEIVTNDAQIRRYHMQIEELKVQVRALEGNMLTKTLQEKNSQIDELKNQVRSLEKKLLVSTLPPQWRKQRRETWAAPVRIDCPPGPLLRALPPLRTTPVRRAVETPEVVEEWGRLSTVVEESETSFHATSYDDFEKQLQREERIRKSAVLHLKDNTLDSLNGCSNTTCAERIAFLENELSILRKEYKELKEMTTLERLMCRTSRRAVLSEKLDAAESTVPILPSESTQTSPLHISTEKTDRAESTPISHLNECCVQTLLASRQHLPCESRMTGAFFSPVIASRALAEHDDSSKASQPATSPEGCQKEESAQGSKLHTPRAVLWTPKHSPAVCLDNTPASILKTPQGGNQKVSEPSCFDQATQTDDMQFLQVLSHIQTLSIKTEDSGMLQQVEALAVDAMCQTDSEDAGEMPRPLIIELSRNDAAERLDDSTLDVNYHKRTLTKSAGIQTTDLCCNIVGDLGRPELADAAISCHLYFEQLVECHVQTEPLAKECNAMELAKQEAECMPSGVCDQVSPLKISSVQSCGVQTFVDAKDHESQVNTSLTDNYRADFGTQAMMAIPIGTCCGVQAIPDVEDYASQVSTSLSEGYRADFGVQAMAEVLSCASQVDVQFTRKGSTDCAVQCELLVPDDEPETPAPKAVDCGVQATLPVQEFATQTQQCLLHCDLRDSDVQVAPSMQDSAVQVEQPSRSNMIHCSVQTTLRSFCDSSTQPECQVPQAVGVTCEVQAVPLTRSCASQVNASLMSQDMSASRVNASLMSQDTPASKSTRSSFATGGNSQFRMFSVKSILADRPENSMLLDASASSSASGSARRQQFGHPGGGILAALQASQRKFVKDGEGGASAGHQKVADHTSPALPTTALGTKAWLQQSKTVRVSVAVQVDIWSVQEMQELHQEKIRMQLCVEKYKKTSQEWESQYKLQEKAAKKREIQLNAVIRQLTNKDADTSVVAAGGNQVAAATSAGGEALQQPGVSAKPLATESSTSLAQRLKAMTPRSREGARLVYFGRSLKEQAIAEEVQMAQLRASAASKAQRLASAERRHQAWAELSSHTGDAEPRSPLKEANQKTQISAGSGKDEILDDMAYWPPMKFFMDDKENEDSS